MRSKFGYTNSPTLVAFRGMYRKILAGIDNIFVAHSNVTLQEETQLLGVVPDFNDKIQLVASHFEVEDDIFYANLPNVSSFKSDVVDYMSGYVVRRIMAKTDCHTCLKSLKSEPCDSMPLIHLRDYGKKLIYPSSFVTKIMVLAEQIICIELHNNILSAKFKFDQIIMRIVSDFIHHHSNIMQQLDVHGYDLCKKIVSLFACIRFKHHAKMTNLDFKHNNLRGKLNRVCINMKC